MLHVNEKTALESPRRRLLVQVLFINVPQTMSELGYTMNVTPSTVDHHVHYLEKLGFVSKRKKEGTVTVRITPDGKDALREWRP